MRRDRKRWPWHMYLLGVVARDSIALAILEIGPPSSSARTSTEVVTAEDGVVQATVTGTGNVEAGTDIDVNFKASGTLPHVYVSEGQHVIKGQLLATLDPTSAQLWSTRPRSTYVRAGSAHRDRERDRDGLGLGRFRDLGQFVATAS